jgi:translocation and assembly module TamB
MQNDSLNPQPESLKPVRTRRSRLIRIAAWILASAATLLVLAIITVAVLLHSQRFHDYVLKTVEQQASDALGVRVTLQNFSLNISHLDLTLYGLTVDGAAPYQSPPLLQVDHAEIGVRVVSILHAKWYLDNFRVDRPIVRVFVDKNGVSNLPTIKSSGSKSNSSTSVFDLAIRRAILDHGEVYYNDRKSVLAGDLHDVEFRATFDGALQKYSGTLAYSDGHLASGELQAIPHSLTATFDATSSVFHLSQAKLTAGASQLQLTATLQNYADPIADASYEAVIDGAQVGQILKASSVPTGQVRATGSIHYQQAANRPLLDALVVNGDLKSSRLDIKTPSLRSHITDLVAHYSLNKGNADLRDLSLHLLGGELTGSGTMSDVAGSSHSKFDAKLLNVSLAQLVSLTNSPQATASVKLSGNLNADLNATWGKTLSDLVARADVGIAGQFQGASSPSKTAGKATLVNTRRVKAAQVNQVNTVSVNTAMNPAVKGNAEVGRVAQIAQVNSTSPLPAARSFPIDGSIHARYNAVGQQISLDKSYIRSSQTNLTMNGTVSNQSNLVLNLQAGDLREVDSIASLFRAPAPGQASSPLGLSGSASLQATVSGSTSAPHVSGQLNASNLQVRGSSWKVVRTSFEASPSLVRLQHGDLEPAGRGHIEFNASAILNKWSFSKDSPIELDVDASQLNIADLAQLSGQAVPVSGTLAANIKVHGTEINPIGSGNVSLTKVVAYDQPVSSLKVTFAGTGEEAHANLAVELPTGSGNINGNVSVRPQERTYTAKMTAAGIHLEKLQALKARNIDATGEVTLDANGRGSFDNPQLDATLSIPQLVVQKQNISAVNLHMNVADHVANATLNTSAVNTQIQAKARVELTGEYMADATLDTQAIPFQPLLAIYAPEQAANLAGETELHATVHGPLKDTRSLEAHLTIPTLKMTYGTNIQLAATSPIKVDYKNGIVDVQRSAIRGTDTDIQFQGSVPVLDSKAPMSAMLLGTVNLQLAQLFDPDVRTSGEMKFNINSSGTTDITGRIDIVNAAYASVDLPVGLQNGNGSLSVSRDRISISKFQGTVGGGTVTAQGGVALRPNVQFDLGLSAQGIRTLYPQGMREGIDANIRLTGDTDAALLSGSVNLTDVSFTSAFDLNSFISQFSGGVSSPPTGGFSQNLQLNLAVRSSSDINLVSRTLSIDGSANLQVRGTAADPVILGRVNLNSGDIILNGDRFILSGGTVQFVNPSETEPVLNVSLKTTIQQYDIYLRFNGPVSQLRTNYNSDPALPSADIINLLAFGSTTEAGSGDPATPANQQAANLVASQVSSQVTSRVSKIAGISQLSINPVLNSGSGQQAGANITIQQRVTGNLFVTFSSNVASTQSQTIQGQYQLSPRVAISATRDQNGGFAFDALIKKSW